MFDGILFVVYRNGIGVMNIQLAEEYKNAEKGEKERGFRGVGAGAREKRDAVRNMSMKGRRD